MSVKSFKTILILGGLFVMFNFFSNLFAQGDNTQLQSAINEGAYLLDVRTPGEFADGTAKGAVGKRTRRYQGTDRARDCVDA